MPYCQCSKAAQPTCGDNDWLPYKEHLEGVPILLSPVSVSLEYLFFSDGAQITKRETGCWARNLSELPSLLPVGAIVDHLGAEFLSTLELLQCYVYTS